MGAIMNGIAVHGGTRVFGGTFLTFSDYMRGVGAAGRADGAAGHLRLDPRLDRPRRGRPDPPADRAPRRAARDPRPRRRTPGRRQRDRRLLAGRPRAHRPPGRAHPDPPERAGLPARRGRLQRHRQRRTAAATCCSTPTAASPTSSSSAPAPRCSSPSQARELLAEKGVRARVVSMPCREWFDAQEPSYRETVIPPTVKARVSVEAGVAQGWREVVGDHGRIVSHRALRRLRRLRAHLPASSASPPRPWPTRPRTASGSPPAEPAPATDTSTDHEEEPHDRPPEGSSPRPESPSGSTTSPASASRPATSPTWSRTATSSGVTTNPSIFAAALADGERYDDQVRELAAEGADVDQDGVRAHHRRRPQRLRRHASRSTTPPTASTAGSRSRSPPTSPTTPTAPSPSAEELWQTRSTGRTCCIKIPAPTEGCPAITDDHRRGHQRQRHPDLRPRALPRRDGGLPRRASSRRATTATTCRRSTRSRRSSSPGSTPRSTSGSTRPAPTSDLLRARPASPTPGSPTRPTRSSSPASAGTRSRPPGAQPQRPLWASTGVKNPDYRDTMYVDDLVVENTVNTMPEKTLDAVADHGEIKGDQVRPTTTTPQAACRPLADAGIDYDDVIEVLEQEGVEKFVKSWDELLETVEEASSTQAGPVSDGARRPDARRRPGRGSRALADGFEPDLRALVRRRPRPRRAAHLHRRRPARRPVQVAVDDDVLAALLALAERGRAWPSGATRCSRGEHINVTEDRAVLHTALRLPGGRHARGRRPGRRRRRARRAATGSTPSPTRSAAAPGPASPASGSAPSSTSASAAPTSGR